MSHKQSKKTRQSEKPLDWIRTDDESMKHYFYIALLTRGMYTVLDELRRAIKIEAETSRDFKAQLHPGWTENAKFCERAVELIDAVTATLNIEWNAEGDDLPNSARRKDAQPGGMYPLPPTPDLPCLLYIPKAH